MAMRADGDAGARRMKSLKPMARTLGGGLLLQAAVLLAAALLHRNATGAAAVQAVLAELGAGQLHVTWSDPMAKAPTIAAIARRALRGAAFAVGLAALLLLVAGVTRAVTFHAVPSLGLVQLASGLLMAGLFAVRDELILRGIILKALHGVVSPAVELVVCGLVAAAVAWGSADGAPTLVSVVSAGVLGMGFAALWKVDRGAWMAWGANATFRYVLMTVTHGAVLDVRVAEGSWAQIFREVL